MLDGIKIVDEFILIQINWNKSWMPAELGFAIIVFKRKVFNFFRPSLWLRHLSCSSCSWSCIYCIYPSATGQRPMLIIGWSAQLLYFHYVIYFMLEGIHTCSRVFIYPMFLWISSNSCPLNLLLVRSNQAEIIAIKRLIQKRLNAARVRVEPRSCN